MLENEAFLLNGPKLVSFGLKPIRKIQTDEVLVEVKKTGEISRLSSYICGSDVHQYANGGFPGAAAPNNFSLGHESSGVVVQVGMYVKNVRFGDRVAMEPIRYCRVCEDCKNGKYELCERLIIASTSRADGTLQRYFAYPYDALYKLPDNLTFEDGAMLEPLSVAVHAVSSIGKLRHGRNVLIFGAGPIGLLCAAVSKALGATEIVVVDIDPYRLEFAKQYAATGTFLPPPQEKDEKKMDYARRVVQLLFNTFGFMERGPKSFHLVLDATGAETCILMSVFAVKAGGTFVQVGMGPEDVQFPINVLLKKEPKITGALAYGPGDYQLSLTLASSGKVDLKPLVTHRFKFEDAVAAFETTLARKGVDESGQMKNVIKTIISGPGADPGEP